MITECARLPAIEPIQVADRWYLERAIRNYDSDDESTVLELLTQGAVKEGILTQFVDASVPSQFYRENNATTTNLNFTFLFDRFAYFNNLDLTFYCFGKNLNASERAKFIDPLVFELSKTRTFLNDIRSRILKEGRKLSQGEMDETFVCSFSGVNGYLGSLGKYFDQGIIYYDLLQKKGIIDSEQSDFKKRCHSALKPAVLYHSLSVLKGLAYEIKTEGGK